MEKKIIKAMFSTIASKDNVRPMLGGVFFDKDCCVATDTHVLVVYHHANAKHVGKIRTADGKEIPGKYPNYKSVFPSKGNMSHYRPRIDLAQLQKACAWFVRQPGFTDKDMVIIRRKALSINKLATLLNLLAMTPEIKTAEMYQTPEGNPAVIKSKSFDALIMPMAIDEDKAGYEAKIDAPRVDDCHVILSLEKLINLFVFEGWKRRPVEDPMSWL